MSIGSIENHRAREAGLLIYPVYSRRSQGLSLGINLFPDHKHCTFGCPYCEIFPFKTNIRFSLKRMETQLQEELERLGVQEIPVKDICFSGNGEPTMHPDFPEALEKAFRIRDKSAQNAKLVVITNGTGLLEARMFETLGRAADRGLTIWLKLDAGTQEWYQKINQSSTPYPVLRDKIREFIRRARVTIQTMRCTVRGNPPPPEELEAWEKLVTELAETENPKAGIEEVQIYSKARPAPEDPLTEALPPAYLEAQAQSLSKALKQAGLHLLVKSFP
ncbi:MAG: radical SAM protein [Treponema sp.]|jgi:histidinol dehydrogenase|nr:radical SAM protein [Treponema sp.]